MVGFGDEISSGYFFWGVVLVVGVVVLSMLLIFVFVNWVVFSCGFDFDEVWRKERDLDLDFDDEFED